MKLKIHIIHRNKELSFSINADMDLAINATIKYFAFITNHKFTKPEINILKAILLNNGAINNDADIIKNEIQSSKRTTYRAKRKLIDLKLIEVKNNLIIPSTKTFETIETIIKL